MVSGLPYFPLECKLDDKLALIEAEFGLKGFGVVVKLWQKIYGLGYYLEWTNEVGLLFAREAGLNGNSVSEIVSAAIKRGIFDKTMYEKYGVLTSVGIQKRYFEAVKRRKVVEVDNRYLLVQVTDFLNPACIFSKNVNISGKNADVSKQRKEEKRKEEKCMSEADTAPDCTEAVCIQLPLNDKTLFDVTESMAQEWSELYPSVNVQQELRGMRGWLNANPSKRKTKAGVRRFINGWLAREQDKGGNHGEPKKQWKRLE